MSYLKLAYLAEFAVVFNLAFGEWKYKGLALEMGDLFESLDKNCEGPLANFFSSIDEETVQKKRSEFSTESLTWKAKSLNRLDRLRRDRSIGSTRNGKYNPPRMFIERSLLFATSPKVLERNQSNGLIGRGLIFLEVAIKFPLGLLASWAYTKTPTWTHPPCPSSLVAWPLVVMSCLVMTLNTTNSGIFLLGPTIAFTVIGFPYIFVFFGALTAFLLPRPVSAIGGVVVGRYPPTPRGRYYPFVIACFVTAVLIIMSSLDTVVAVKGFEVVPEVALLTYFLGFLSAATIIPILLFLSYIYLRTSTEHWTKWTEDRARHLADKGISSLTAAPL